jgi:hypothetical protein
LSGPDRRRPLPLVCGRPDSTLAPATRKRYQLELELTDRLDDPRVDGRIDLDAHLLQELRPAGGDARL